MFPNPPDALPLPSHPSLERYKKLAKELTRACKSGEPDSIRQWAEEWIASLVSLSGIEVRPGMPVKVERWVRDVEEFAVHKLSGSRTCALSDAQFVIARSHGFESWPKFARLIDALARSSSSERRFEAAADAIVSGDVATLKRLLREEPELIHARSGREHGATLLHYVSANGVEGYRQKTPPNIVEIAEILLRAGADVDATANVYDGGCTALGLAATSIHPQVAGVQEALLRTLLDHGASVEQRSIAGRGQPIVLSCLANGRPEAAAFLASRGAVLDLAGAAGLGRLDLVEVFFKSDVTLEQLNEAFLYACEFDRVRVVEFLIERGASVTAHRRDRQTPLHCAVIGGGVETVKLLLQHDPPLEARNSHGGTVLGQALWSAAHDGDCDAYAAIIEMLIAAGASVPSRHVPVNDRIDDLLRRHGSEPEPSWSWDE
jgi:ankyrin repeat protein